MSDFKKFWLKEANKLNWISKPKKVIKIFGFQMD